MIAINAALLNILRNSALGFEELALATEGLPTQSLITTDFRLLRKRLQSGIAVGASAAPLVAALLLELFAHKPESAPQLLRTLKRKTKHWESNPTRHC